MMKVLSALVILFVSASCSCFAQDLELINGIVADSATFIPLQYVNVQVKNSTRGTSSDSKGNFSIPASRKDTLLFSFIGYRTVELSLWDWEPSVVLLPEESTILKSITIRDSRLDDGYQYLFEEENELLRRSTKKLPFYYSKSKKENIKVRRLDNENLRVKTYVDLVMNNQDIKNGLMKKYRLSEAEYYDVLLKFNEKNSRVMYYLTASELLSILNRFFEAEAPRK